MPAKRKPRHWTYTPKGAYAFQKRKWVRRDGDPAGCTLVTDASVNLEVEIDFHRLFAQLGEKATFNKSHTAKALNGAVVVRAKLIGDPRTHEHR